MSSLRTSLIMLHLLRFVHALCTSAAHVPLRKATGQSATVRRTTSDSSNMDTASDVII